MGHRCRRPHVTTTRSGYGKRVGLLSLLLVGTVTGCAGGDDDEAASPSEASQASEAEVVMKLVAFTPDQLEVAAGTTVTWTNRDAGAHTVTSGTVVQGGAGVTQEPDGTFDSDDIPKGETFEQTFDEPGTYPYFCALHPATMRGEIRVT
jgi:plastocyanin